MWRKNSVVKPSPLVTFVWDDHFKAVWHLNDTDDATVNQYHAINYATNPAEGLIGGAFDFRKDSSSYVDTPENLKGYGIENKLTLSCWFKSREPSPSLQILTEDGKSAGDDSIYLGIRETSCYVQVYASSRKNIDSLPIDPIGTVWHYVALVYDGSRVKFYFDAEEMWNEPLTGMVINSNARLQLGCRPDGASYFFDGIMDEVRVSSVGRSEDWIWACWQNQGANNTFNSYGKIVSQVNKGAIFILR
ncbi:MAG: LamG domain-containing protein [Lentisphaerae bacterium]|nr:LamG domain-containing protein [Lentisphaerota bacterium]